jgi:hypothetical protein
MQRIAWASGLTDFYGVGDGYSRPSTPVIADESDDRMAAFLSQ